jgi:hypothetical protein
MQKSLVHWRSTTQMGNGQDSGVADSMDTAVVGRSFASAYRHQSNHMTPVSEAHLTHDTRTAHRTCLNIAYPFHDPHAAADPPEDCVLAILAHVITGEVRDQHFSTLHRRHAFKRGLPGAGIR